MAETGQQQTISVVCSCGRKLKAPATAVGKKAKCPCGNVLTVTAPKPKPKPPAPPPSPQDDSLDALYDLAQQGEETSRQTADMPKCPKCFAEMSADAVLCTNCGFDRRTGKAIAPQIEKVRKAANLGKPGTGGLSGKKQVEDAMAPQGSFIKGLAASGVAASAGGLVWFLIAWGTGYELYFIALLVGILAGLGMQWGHQGYSYGGGFAASGITFVVMILAKVAVVFAVLLPLMRAEGDALGEDGEYDERVVDMLVEDYLKSKGTNSEDATIAQHEAAYKSASKQLKAMSKPQYQEALKRAEDLEKREELVEYVADDVLKNTMKVDPENANDTQMKLAEKQARTKVDAMTPQQRTAELKRLEGAASAEMKAKLAELEKNGAKGGGESDSSDAGGTAGAVGFVVLLLLLFGWKSALFMIGALVIAFRTAAGSTSG